MVVSFSVSLPLPAASAAAAAVRNSVPCEMLLLRWCLHMEFILRC